MAENEEELKSLFNNPQMLEQQKFISHGTDPSLHPPYLKNLALPSRKSVTTAKEREKMEHRILDLQRP